MFRLWYRIIVKHFRRYTWVLFLWTIFSIGCMCAPFIAITLPFTWKTRYIQHFIKAADRLCAAMLGFTGRHLLSTELAHSKHLQWMRVMLNEIEHNHCESSAYEEGAYCRISDRTLGHK